MVELARKLREARGERRTTEKRWEVRQGDWTCKVPECRGWSNFQWRHYCFKCGKDKEGKKDPRLEAQREDARVGSLGQSPRERFKKRFEEQREPIRRPPRMIIITINVMIGGKTRTRPQTADHYTIIRQAGLNIDEVTGKVAKPGYLEVSLIPGSASAAKALREVHKQVNEKITITSVRERGSNRVVVIKWQEVPFDVLDETLIQYVELFAKVEKAGRSLRWEVVREEEDPSQEMVGKWSGERSVPVTLNRDITNIPTWHYVGGGRLRLHVPGRRNCPRCLKTVGECRGGGEWGRCEASKAPVGDWKIEQEKFLEALGWGDSKQKILEGLEQQEAVSTLVGEEEEAETRSQEEQAEREVEEREGLTQELDADKVCGGLILKNFPEINSDRKKEKNEALGMVIIASNLTDNEEERLGEAKVELNRSNRGGKQLLEVRISLEGIGADFLLRKVWKQLDRACKQENVKKYQVEACTPTTPPKVKPQTEFQKARERVRELMDKDETWRLKEKEEAKAAKQQKEEIESKEISWQEANTKGKDMKDKSQEKRIPWDCHDVAFCSLESRKEKQMQSNRTAPQVQVQIEKEYTGEVTDDEDNVAEELGGNKGSMDITRRKTPLWKASAGWRRCGQSCTGCKAQCVELGLTECWGCWTNNVDCEKPGKKVKKSPCFSRGPCLNMRPQNQQKNVEVLEQDSAKEIDRRARSQNKSTSNMRRMSSLSVSRSGDNISDRASKSPVSREVVGSQLVVLKPGLVAQIGDALEASEKVQDDDEQLKKRGREETGITPEKEQEKPVAKASKTVGGGSKIAQPIGKGGLVARGERPSATNL